MDLVETNRRRIARRARVRADRHRRLRRRPLLRRLGRVREGVARGRPRPDHGDQPRPRARRRCTCCPRSGSATPGRGRRARPKPALREVRRPGGTRVIAAAHAELGQRWLYVDGDVPLLFTENETNTERALRQAERAAPTSRTASTTTSCMAATTRVEPPSTVGTKAAAHRPGPARGRRDAGLPAPVVGRGASARSRDPFAGFDDVFDVAPARGRRVLSRRSLPSSASQDAGATSCARRWPGMMWSKQYLLPRCRPLARRARRRAVRRGRHARIEERRLGAHGQRRRDLHAGQVGVPLVRGVGSGVPRHGAVAPSTSTSRSRSSS